LEEGKEKEERLAALRRKKGKWLGFNLGLRWGKTGGEWLAPGDVDQGRAHSGCSREGRKRTT
jgi:hypothetical protein